MNEITERLRAIVTKGIEVKYIEIKDMDSESVIKKVEEDVKEDQILSEALLFLEPMDMIPLPCTESIISGILTGIMLGAASSKEISGVLTNPSEEPSDECMLAIENFTLLQNDAAIGFPGNLRERKGMVDQNAYVAEVLGVEKARVGMKNKTIIALNALSENLTWEGKDNPIFVQFVIGSNDKYLVDKAVRVIGNKKLICIYIEDLSQGVY